MTFDRRTMFARLAARILSAKRPRRGHLKTVLPMIADCELEPRLLLSASSDDEAADPGNTTSGDTSGSTGDTNSGGNSGETIAGGGGGDTNMGGGGGDTTGDGGDMLGWAMTSPAHQSTIYLDQIDGDVFIVGTRGNNPNQKTIHLSVWDLNDIEAEEPWMAVTIPDGTGPTWSVSIGRRASTYSAELWWTGMPTTGEPVFRSPQMTLFSVENYGGDPIPT